jgi:formylglycine-generating enzyme required for sulfatase activity
MTRRVPLWMLCLLTLTVLPLAAQEDPSSAAQAAVTQARQRLKSLKTELATLYKQLEHDFSFVRSEKWAGLSTPYVDALTIASAARTTEPEQDPAPTLTSAFTAAGLLHPVVNERLALAAAEILAGKDATPPPAEVLAGALRRVFPGETFEECWETAFLDVPLVLAFKEAGDALAAAEKDLEDVAAAAAEDPTAPPGMVLIPRGRFLYGPWDQGWKNDLKANKQVKERSDAYFIDRREVSNAKYREFLLSVKDPARKKDFLAFGFRLLEDGTIVIPEGQEDWPVRGVTLTAAAAYAESVGKRLPTEEEWEKAARGEDGRIWPWGNEFDEAAANCATLNLGRPAPVGSRPLDVSPYGVLDMAGNVSELTATLDERRPFKGKLKATDSAIYRGGNYREGRDTASTTYRWILSAIAGRSELVGFRCVISEKEWKRRSR